MSIPGRAGFDESAFIDGPIFLAPNFLMKFLIHETQPRKVYPDVQLWIDCSGCVCLLRLTTERVHEVLVELKGEHMKGRDSSF